MKIAALIDANGQVISFNRSALVKLYQKEEKEWKVIKEIVFGISMAMSTQEIRQEIRIMAEALEDCKVFIASEVTGIPFAILEGLGFTIWEAQGNPADYLDYILEKEEAQKIEVPKPQSIPAPIQNGREGCYYLDLKTIMDTSDRDNVSSKKILQPFLNHTSFTELQILCSHIPHWFDQEFQRLNLQAEIEELGTTRIKVTVTPKKRHEHGTASR